MRKPPSLTLRLTLLFAVAAAIVFTGFGWVIERSIERHFVIQDVAELESVAHAVSQTLANHDATDKAQALEQRFNDVLVGHHGTVLYITKPDGRTLFVSPGGPDLSALDRTAFGNNKNGSVHYWSNTRHTYRVLTRRLAENTATTRRFYTMSIAVAIDGHLRFLDHFRLTLWLMIASGTVLMGLMGWIAVRRGHAPLRSIVTQIHRISANELNTRLSPETVPRELTDLANSFNDMLARMEEAFQRLSNFSADIAHELRTPVTSLLTQTQVALSQSRSIDEYREILYSNIEEYERMAQMVSDMLFLAKADNGQYQLNRIDVDFTREVQDLFDYYEAWAEERGVSLALHGNATLPADRLMLRRVLGNLLSNAIRHTPSDNTVHVRLEQLSGQTISISVENPGPVIPAEHIPRLFDRFHRVDASRHRSDEGAGLGLSIVKSIIDIHGGTVEVDSTEKCTRFRVILHNL
ncbi:MAG: heavy metal sensor histidine kinase, partial [Gammaproteobacteria bacterium]|nr:heavy metal sensor histidine kinase [Gammaproteobacteria bacterium]